MQSLAPLTPAAFQVDHVRGALTVYEWPLEFTDMEIVSGWTTPATLLAEAPLLVEAVGLLTAHYATFGRDLAISGPATRVPAGYDEAIAPHRLVWVT